MREMSVVARAAVPLTNGEAARCGQAATAVNVRECEQSLQVTGQPAVVGHITAGDRLLTMVDGHAVTCRGRSVMLDGQHAVAVDGDIVGAYKVGPLVVVVTATGLTYLLPGDDGWQVMDPADAVPSLTLAASVSTVDADIAAGSLSRPMSTGVRPWPMPTATRCRHCCARRGPRSMPMPGPTATARPPC